ncbi:hypothetical protein COOONC_24181 [Cooperia oncophora]
MTLDQKWKTPKELAAQTSAEPQEIRETELTPRTSCDRYNLRSRPRLRYDLLHHGTLITILCTSDCSDRVGLGTSTASMQCTPEGMLIKTSGMKSYELCSEGSCITRDNPPESELIRLPPEITLHEHKVHWKVTNGTKMKTVETTCPAMPFCPQRRLLVVHGKCLQSFNCLTDYLLIVTCALQGTRACQDVDIFEHRMTTCTKSASHRQNCTVDVTEIVKLNTFNKEACFRITNKEIRLEWKTLQLICDKQTITYTRAAKQHVLSSKRCSHIGSCVDTKCAGVNTTTLLPELMEANLFPGVTYCVESCGGPGCGCFYLSSGCLFYRVFMKPESTEIFEIFSCSRWREEVVLHITVTTDKKTTVNEARHLRPTISVQHQP